MLKGEIMSNKTFTAHDLKMGKLEIGTGKNEDGQDILVLIREYHFVNDSGRKVGGLAKQRLVRDILWSDIPTDIKNAFTKLHNYTRSEALKEQGME